MTLQDLYTQINAAHGDRERQASLYNDHLHEAIQAEGFSKEQAQLIEGEAYDRGHAYGYAEVVNMCFGLTSFANRLLAAPKP